MRLGCHCDLGFESSSRSVGSRAVSGKCDDAHAKLPGTSCCLCGRCSTLAHDPPTVVDTLLELLFTVVCSLQNVPKNSTQKHVDETCTPE